MAFLSAGQANSGTVISVDFDRYSNSTFTGVGSMAAAANAAFSDSDVSNGLLLSYSADGSGADVNPSFSALVDSTGESTTVGLDFTGTVPLYYNAYGDEIWSRFHLAQPNPGGNHATIDSTLTGLPGNAPVDLYFYNVHTHDYRSFDMHYDGDGDGSLESSVVVDWQNDGYVGGIVAGPTGQIKGSMRDRNRTAQASWGGFQINIVPEPSPLALLMLSLSGMIACGRRRQR